MGASPVSLSGVSGGRYRDVAGQYGATAGASVVLAPIRAAAVLPLRAAGTGANTHQYRRLFAAVGGVSVPADRMLQLCSHPVRAGSTTLTIQRFAPGYAELALQRTRRLQSSCTRPPRATAVGRDDPAG